MNVSSYISMPFSVFLPTIATNYSRGTTCRSLRNLQLVHRQAWVPSIKALKMLRIWSSAFTKRKSQAHTTLRLPHYLYYNLQKPTNLTHHPLLVPDLLFLMAPQPLV